MRIRLKNIRYHGVFTPEKTFNQKSPVSQGRHPNRKIGFNRPFPCFDVLAEALAPAEYFSDKHGALTFDCKFFRSVGVIIRGEVPCLSEIFLDRVHVRK